jgi:ATP-dependent exoDNAse (exonuclease V) alpha subunit
LQRVWDEKAARQGYSRERRDQPHGERSRSRAALEDRVEDRLTEQAATFGAGELRAVLLEQSAGELAPADAFAKATAMIAERRILPLEGGRMTTLALRAKEQAIERRVTNLARPAGRDVSVQTRATAAGQVAERIGARLSDEQAYALQIITGPQRLGRESPRLARQSLTLDALVTRAEHGRLALDTNTTVFFDEAGMADTSRLDRLTDVVERSGAKLVLIGDGAQLPSIGAGGMFDRLANIAPTAALSDVRRTLDPAEQKAWADLRAGRSDRAMAHYLRRGRLHMADTRDQAIENAVSAWADLTTQLPVEQVALISDASNLEIARLNARAQHHRAQRGELGEIEVHVPGVHYGIRAGDRVAMIDQHHQPGAQRIENGAKGEVLDITDEGDVLIQFDATHQWRTLTGDELAKVRLGYATHIHRAQGATVTRTLVVTGGWQTSKENAYVQASRAREGTDWYVNRQDLGEHGHDTQRIKRLARDMSRSRTQTPSLAHRAPLENTWEIGRDANDRHGPGRYAPRLPGMVRTVSRILNPPAPERTR